MSHTHLFEGDLHWTARPARTKHGKLKLGRAFVLRFEGVAPLEGSSPAVFRGDDGKHNPETLMVSSLMACHHLTYLSVCERAGIRPCSSTATTAPARSAMKTARCGWSRSRWPRRSASPTPRNSTRRAKLHAKAHAHCFMSNSVNFEVKVEPAVTA